MPADGVLVGTEVEAEVKRDLVEPDRHLVHFYERDEQLVEALVTYFASGLEHGEAVVCLAKQSHIEAVESSLAARGIDLAEAKRRETYIAIDASLALEFVVTRDEIMGRALPKRELFERFISDLYTRAAGPGRRPVRAFGEMVTLLCGENNPAAAICLEDLWNETSEKHDMHLFCGYPKDLFASAGWAELGEVCQRHGYVLETTGTAERYEPTSREILFVPREGYAPFQWGQGTDPWGGARE